MNVVKDISHYYYVDHRRKRIHFYNSCKDIIHNINDLEKIDRDICTRKYIIRNTYNICESCSDMNIFRLSQTITLVAFVFCLIASLGFKKDHNIRLHKLWISSPAGNYYALPFYTALRVVRKRKWRLLDTVPKKGFNYHLKRFSIITQRLYLFILFKLFMRRQ